MNLHAPLIRLLASACTVAVLASGSLPAEDLDRARSAYAEWARVKNQTSAEASEWRREKALLDDTLAAARAELAALDARITELHGLSTDADKRRAELTAAIDEAKSTVASLTTRIAAAERALQGLLPSLPPPLLAELQPVLQRLPADPASTDTPVAQRVQTIAVALGQIEKFNSNYALVSEIRELREGRSVEVKTLYLGLAVAYYADASGATAGYGVAGPSGWTWKSVETETAARIAHAIAIHENTKAPAFVSLPVDLR